MGLTFENKVSNMAAVNVNLKCLNIKNKNMEHLSKLVFGCFEAVIRFLQNSIFLI